MKTLKQTFLATVLITGLYACKNDTVKPTALASVNVTNAVVGGSSLTLNTSTLTVGNNSYAQFSLTAGQSKLDLYPAATPNSPYYNQTFSTANSSYYSLFLSGASPTAVDATLIKESYKNYTDSLCGVRFINLSPGSNPVSVNLAGSANGSEINSLAYKSYTDFKQYAAKRVNTSYAFQFRDAATGSLIASYTLSTPYFNNVTLVLRGLETGSPAAGITLVKDY
jgi:hypothetical protein